MAEERRLDLPGMFSVMKDELRRKWMLVAVSVAVLLVADEFLDQVIGLDGEFVDLLIYLVPSMILAIIMQFLVARSALSTATLSVGGSLHWFGVYICMALLTTILTALGLLLLIIPGVYVMSRWMLAGPIILCEKKGALDSMKASWERMEFLAWPMFWALFLMYVVGFGLLLLPICLLDEKMIPPHWEVLFSAAAYLISFLACLLAVGVYRRLPQSDAGR